MVFVKFWIRIFGSISIRDDKVTRPIFPVILTVGVPVWVSLLWIRVSSLEKKSLQ